MPGSLTGERADPPRSAIRVRHPGADRAAAWTVVLGGGRAASGTAAGCPYRGQVRGIEDEESQLYHAAE